MLYTRKPSTLEAMEFTPTNGQEIMAWAAGDENKAVVNHVFAEGETEHLQVLTPNGWVKAFFSDFIARDPVPGFFYPISASVFHELYDPAAEIDTSAPLLDFQPVVSTDTRVDDGTGPEPNPEALDRDGGAGEGDLTTNISPGERAAMDELIADELTSVKTKTKATR